MKTSIRSVIISVSIIGVLLVSLLAPGVAYAQDQDPVRPSAFYGEVTVNEAPASIGTEITGRIVDPAGLPGEGSIEVTEEGKYGGPDWLDGKLNIVTDSYSDVGKDIEFWVQLPGWANPVKADQTATYIEDSQWLGLNVTLPPADLESLAEDLVADFVPAFEAGVYEYALAAADDEDGVTLTATMEGATITYSYGEVEDKVVASGVGEVVPLEVGENIITISAELEGYESTTYAVTVTRAVPPVSATISPIETSYDLYAPGDIETTITWNDATEVVSVTYGEATLIVDTDYTVSEVALAILQSYIEGIDPAVDDALVFTIAFDVGEDATFTVNVIDTTLVSATISPIETSYDLYAPGDVETTITWNDATEVVSVTYGEATLTVATDYTVTAIDGTATLAILQSYIEGIDPAVAVDDALVFTIAFDVGDPATFTVTAIDTTPVPGSATISPIEANYDLFVPGDIETTITWNDATAVASISDGGDLTVVDDYIVDGTTLAIKDAYLAGKLLAVGDSVVLTIAFDAGDPATFTITAIDTTPVYDVLLTLNDGWTLISTDKWIDADSSAWEGTATLVYRYTSEGYLEATLADLEPVEALYVKMPGGGQARLTYSDVVPGVSAKELVAGWNLISSATADDAAAVLSPLRYVQIGEQQVVGLTTLVSQGNYNVSGVSLYLATLTDANWDTLAVISLNPFDGYWVYMNAAKSFGVIPE